MLDFFKPSFWFQKRTSALDDARVRLEQMSQYNALFHLDPDKIVGAITAYNSGDLAQLAHIIRDLEQHDDKMATCSMKMKASVGRCDWSVQIKDGFTDDARAKRHAEILKRFWSTVNVTSRFNQNERGGIRLLKKQMMEAQSFGYAVHEIVWKPLKNGEIAAEFIKLQLWHFENRTGALRFLPRTTATDGVPMAEGEWLVTTGDGVGIPAAICAMAKRMSFQDWLLFSERSGMPIIVGKTGAQFGSDQWKNIKAAIRSIYRDTRVLLDSASDITAIDTGHAANIPFPPLVEWADRAIAALYRGADLSTISKGDGTGASLQGDESGMIEQDAAANLGETLHEQVDRFVIRYVTGDDEPLAQIVIEPVTKPDVDTDIKIDRHLAELGVKLSKADALQRYGRTEAQGDDDALELAPNAPQMGLQGGLNGFANEEQPKTPFKNAQKPFKNAPGDSDGQGDAQALKELVGAFSRDLGPAAEEVKKLLADLDAGKDVTESAKSLVSRLPSLLPADPEGAAILAEAMAGAFASVSAAPRGEDAKADLANSGTSEGAKKGWETRRKNGWTPEQVAENKVKIVDLAKKALSDRSSDDTLIMGNTEGEAAKDIKALTGIDVSGYSQEISTHDIRHEDKRHGTPRKINKKKYGERRADQVPISTQDFERIPELLSDYDNIELGDPERNTDRPSVVYTKTYPDGVLYGVEVVIEDDKKMHYKTGWKKKL